MLLPQDPIIDSSIQPLEIQAEEAVTDTNFDVSDQHYHFSIAGVVIKFSFFHQQPSEEFQNLIVQHMDISEPLSTLRRLLQQRLATDLSQHEFFLQDVVPVSVHDANTAYKATSACIK